MLTQTAFPSLILQSARDDRLDPTRKYPEEDKLFDGAHTICVSPGVPKSGLTGSESK